MSRVINGVTTGTEAWQHLPPVHELARGTGNGWEFDRPEDFIVVYDEFYISVDLEINGVVRREVRICIEAEYPTLTCPTEEDGLTVVRLCPDGLTRTYTTTDCTGNQLLLRPFPRGFLACYN